MLTADLCDKYPSVNVLDPMHWQICGQRSSFQGKIRTIKCFESNPLVRKTLESNGDGNVLVVDGGGSRRCALLGDNLAALMVKNNWNGILIYGCIRDKGEINSLDVSVKYLDTNPKKSSKLHPGELDIPVTFGGITFTPGHFIYSDLDGVIVSETKLEL